METEKAENQPEIVENIDGTPGGGEGHLGAAGNQAELTFQKFQKRRLLKKKMAKMGGFAVVVLMILGAGLAVYLRSGNDKEVVTQKQEVKVEIPAEKEHVFINDVSGIQEDQDDAASADDESKGLAGESENYRIKDISIGGGNIVLAAGTEQLPLKVTEVRSETLMSKDGKKTQVLLSWKTNKLAKSEVGYSKDGKGAEKNIKEDGYGFSHALVMSNLEQSTRYLFTVSASDRSGTKSVSDSLAVYTGSKPVSVIDLITGQMNEIFGWALKK